MTNPKYILHPVPDLTPILPLLQEIVEARHRIWQRARSTEGSGGTSPDEIDGLYVDYLNAQLTLSLFNAGIIKES